MREMKIPPQVLALKMQGLMSEGGGVFAGHYGISLETIQILPCSKMEVIACLDGSLLATVLG